MTQVYEINVETYDDKKGPTTERFTVAGQSVEDALRPVICKLPQHTRYVKICCNFVSGAILQTVP